MNLDLGAMMTLALSGQICYLELHKNSSFAVLPRLVALLEWSLPTSVRTLVSTLVLVTGVFPKLNSTASHALSQKGIVTCPSSAKSSVDLKMDAVC